MLKEQDTQYVLEFVDDDKKKGLPVVEEWDIGLRALKPKGIDFS